MHMADALLSPSVGAAFIAGSGVALAVSAGKVSREADERKVPLMGVMGAFVFAAQMINFTIPGTGSSGHLGGGMLLALILGPWAAFITIASVLIVQALFFADGGILALGTNIWNMGVYPCFIGWLVYKAVAGKNPSRSRVSLGAALGVLIGLEMGALTVVLQTVLSGRSELPVYKFGALMAGIHLPIAIVEALITIAVVNFVYAIRPEIVRENLGLKEKFASQSFSYRPVIASMIVAALLAGGVVAWFASSRPDGLEWSISRAYGQEELPAPKEGIIARLAQFQEKISILPDYDFRASPQEKHSAQSEKANGEENGDIVSPGTSVSGVVGSLIVLVLIGGLGFAMVRFRRSRAGKKPDIR